MGDIADWTLLEVADAMAARRVSAVEVAAALLGSIAYRQPQLNAYIRIVSDRAHAAAKAADEHLARHVTARQVCSMALRWRTRTCSNAPACRSPAALRSVVISVRTISRPCCLVSMRWAPSNSARSI